MTSPRTNSKPKIERGKIIRVDGQLARRVWVPDPLEEENGGYYKPRFVAPPGMTLKEARTKGLDFWHPKVGWLRGGYKMEFDFPLTPAEIGGLEDFISGDYSEDPDEDELSVEEPE